MARYKNFKVRDLKVLIPNGKYEYKNRIFSADNWTHALELAKAMYDEHELLALGVDPLEHIDTPLWMVSGPKCFPQLTLVKILRHPQCGPTIWGWSVYRNMKGFRTLGINLATYLAQNENTRFYLNRQDAFSRLADLIPEVP